jgi:superfamily II DNA/RNA helicase
MVFVNKCSEAVGAVKELWKDCLNDRGKGEYIRWFHSGMTAHFKRETIKDLKQGKLWGVVCTDTAGMVCESLT